MELVLSISNRNVSLELSIHLENFVFMDILAQNGIRDFSISVTFSAIIFVVCSGFLRSKEQ